MDDYGGIFDKDGLPLDVKGAGWIASFPAENISLEVYGTQVSATKPEEDYLTEEFELIADTEPHKFDFLGRGIDAGFRVSKNASSDRFTPSLELSYLLSEASLKNVFSAHYFYHGREVLKGVNRDRPYPIVSIDTERSPERRILKARERLITQEPEASPLALRDYLRAFLDDAAMELPSLPDYPEATPPTPPPSYDICKSAWNVNVREASERDESVIASEEPENQSGAETLPAAVQSFADAFKAPQESVSARRILELQNMMQQMNNSGEIARIREQTERMHRQLQEARKRLDEQGPSDDGGDAK